MTTQTSTRRTQAIPSKMMRVAPTVTDPSMQSNKSQADVMLAEMGENPDSVDEVVFNRKNQTKEEQEHQTAPVTSSDNTMLIIIFALIVVALVSIMVWMLMKQGNDKKEEEEVRRMVQPHPRNGMPPMNRYPGNHGNQQHPQFYGNHNTRPVNRQQHPTNQHPNQHPNQQPNQQPIKKPMGPNSSGVVVGASAEDKLLSDSAEADVETESNFTKNNPHPDIIKPGVVEPPVAPAASDVDDVMKRTEAMLNAKTTEAKPNTMNDADRALLDRIAKDGESDNDDEDDEDDA